MREGGVDRNQQSNNELVALSIAMVFVYKSIMGAPIEQGDVSEVNAILHDVAHAVSNVAPIFGSSGDGKVPSALAPFELIDGAFHRGATIFRTRNGIEYTRLCIRRADMQMAIIILRGAGARFGQSKSAPN